MDAKAMHPRGNILGVHINAINLPEAVETIDSWIARREGRYICCTAAHSVMECRRDPDLTTVFNNSGLSLPDGMAIAWLLKWKGYSGTERVYAPDFLIEVCRHSLPRKWRHFFYGGNPGVAERLADRLTTMFPGLIVAGTFCPPFRPLEPDEDRAVIRRIADSGADVVWVGTGSIKQEKWMRDHTGRLPGCVLIGVGAAFDFVSGNKPQAPRWIQRIGFEWFFRLLTEPRRLLRRYSQYPLFCILAVAQTLGFRKYS